MPRVSLRTRRPDGQGRGACHESPGTHRRDGPEAEAADRPRNTGQLAQGREGGSSVPPTATSFWKRRAEGLPLRHWRNPRSGYWRRAPARGVGPVEIRGHPDEDGFRVARAADAPGEEDELVKVGDGGPALPNGSEGGLVVYVHDDAAPRDELPEGPRPKMTPQTSRGLIWVALSERDGMMA